MSEQKQNYAYFFENESACLDCNLVFKTACEMTKHLRDNPDHKPINMGCCECKKKFMILWKRGYCKDCWDKNHVIIKFSNGKSFVVTKEGEEVLSKIATTYCVVEDNKQ